MTEEKKYKVEFTKKEADSISAQISARIDALKELQTEAGKEGNIKRVIELEEFMKPIISAKEKVNRERYKNI